MGKSKRKRMNDMIPSTPTANITEEMRKERQAEGEVFENVKTATVAPDVSTRSTKSTRSLRRVRDKNLHVTILPEEPPIQFDNDILSVYSQTQGTISLDSVSDVETGPVEKLKEKQKESILPPEKVLNAARIKSTIDGPPKALPVTDALFCERIHPDGPFMADHRKGDIEMDFVDQLISSVLKIVNSAGSTELELKITLDREDNGLPKVKFDLIPKARLKNPIERLNRAYVQYAKFHEEMGVLSDCETATSRLQQAQTDLQPEATQIGSRFSLLAVFNSMFSNPGTPTKK